MAQRVEAKTYAEFRDTIEKLYVTGKEAIFVYFTGAKNENGVSWCPDCVRAQPFILESVEKYANKDSIFLTVDVGDRSTWKDMNNQFRLDPDIKISNVPTVLRWKGPQRLEGDQCENNSLLKLLFRYDDSEVDLSTEND